MLRPRIARAALLAVLVPVVFLSLVFVAEAQLLERKPKEKPQGYVPPQTQEESTRFLKAIPKAPGTQLPYPSINTPPIEDQAPIPLLTESQQKQQEEELARLGKSHGEPKAKQTAKSAKAKPKQEAADGPAQKADKKPKTREASKPLVITK